MRTKTENCIECKNTAKDGKYCNSCQYKKRKQYYAERYINNGGYQAYKLKYRKIRLNPFKELIRKRASDSCEKCGWNKYFDILQAHHINRNRNDNSPENLLLLCPTCHQVEHYLEHTGIYTNQSK